jgi:hypothetical protein
MLKKPEKCLAIVGLVEKFWGLAAIPGEELGSNLIQRRRGEKGILLLQTFEIECQILHFISPSYK